MNLTLSERAVIARAVAATVEDLPEVVRLARGSMAATYYPGGKTDGVIIRDGYVDLAVEVHVVMRSLYATAAAERVRLAVEEELMRHGHAGVVHVVVEDLELGEPSILGEAP